MEERVGAALAWAAAVAVTIASVAWMIANPLPAYWDEAVYFVNAVHDVRAIHAGGWRGLAGTLSFEDPSRPPAHRLLALPATLLFGPRLFVLRLTSFCGFLIAVAFAAAATRQNAGLGAAGLATMISLSSPMLLLSTRVFGTEYPLLIASAALLFFQTMPRPRRDLRWLGAGLALGLGALSKVSFVLIGGAMMAAALLLAYRRESVPPLRHQLYAIALGAALAVPWWWRDARAAIHYADSSRTVLRHSLGSPLLPATFGRWLWEFVRCDTGLVTAALLCLAAGYYRARRGPAMTIALAGALPLLIASYRGPNHNPRYPVAAVLLLSVFVAIALRPILQKVTRSSICFGLAMTQVVLTCLPSRSTQSFMWRGVLEVNAPVEQWEFGRLKDAAERLGAPPRPRIAALGVGYALNPPQLEAAWIRRGSDAAVRTLWAADREPFDLDRTLARAMTADVVVTAPGFAGDPSDRQPRDNSHNAEFVQALAAGRGFAGPYRLDVGITGRAPIAFFVRQGGPIRAAPQARAPAFPSTLRGQAGSAR